MNKGLVIVLLNQEYYSHVADELKNAHLGFMYKDGRFLVSCTRIEKAVLPEVMDQHFRDKGLKPYDIYKIGA